MIPYSTDAPIYHWPIATVGLIVVNVTAFAAVMFLGDPSRIEPYYLEYGRGLHPVQWVTSNFLHAGLMHLIANMIYLWGFGLIVEGKVGWWRFLLLYLGIGATQCAIEQALMLHADPTGHSLGASAIIYGLVAIGMVWAPRNELGILLIYGWGFMLRTAVFDLPILTFAVIYFVLEALRTILAGLAWGSPVLHLIGAGIGFIVGTAMVKLDWVDCEGWDLYSIRRGDRGKKKKRGRKTTRGNAPRAGDVSDEEKSARALSQLRGSIEAGAPYEALSAYQAMARMPEGWRPLERDLLGLVKLLQREGLTAESIPIMEDYAARFPEGSARVRLKLAALLLRDQHRPSKALRILADVPEADLPADLRPIRRQIEAQATALREAEGGAYELDED